MTDTQSPMLIARAEAENQWLQKVKEISTGNFVAIPWLQDAVRLIKEIYSIDMEENQHSKLLSDIPPVHVVIKMGCNVVCPLLSSEHEEDWGLDDPTGKSDEEFKIIIYEIEKKVKELTKKLVK